MTKEEKQKILNSLDDYLIEAECAEDEAWNYAIYQIKQMIKIEY